MAFKLITLLAIATVARAGFLPTAEVLHTAHNGAHLLHAAPAAHIFHTAPTTELLHAAPAAKILHSVPAAQIIHAGPTVVKSAPLTVGQPILTKNEDEYDPHPQYNFAYDIQDGLSGDSKSQSESRDGDIVRGQYSLIDADGFKRTVDYTADPVNGFNAIVNREPLVSAAHEVKPQTSPLALTASPTILKT